MKNCCAISSGPSLFAKVPVMGFSVYKGLSMNSNPAESKYIKKKTGSEKNLKKLPVATDTDIR